MNGERSRVQLIKSKFETLSHAQDDQIIATSSAVKKTKPVFQRSRTSTNLLEAKTNTCNDSPVQHNILRAVNSNKVTKVARQTDDIKKEFRSSIKRSPAFRKTGDRATKLPSPTSDEKKSLEPEFVNLTDTLKKALKQPLPKGDPPRKPKRTFETNIEELGYVEICKNKAKPRKRPECLIISSPKSPEAEQEPVYMDPQFCVKAECCSHTNNTKDLHYMCSAVKDTHENNDNNASAVATTYDQINILLGAAYADANKPDQHEPIGVTKLARSLTEKRKDYVIRTASRKDEYRKTVYSLYNTKSKKDEEVDSIEPVKERLNKYKRLIEGSQNEPQIDRNSKAKSPARDKKHSLFQTCSLVGFDITKRLPYVKWTFPNTEPTPENLEELVFPSSQLVYQQNLSNQNYIQIITNLEGHRTYAFCRRVIPEGPTSILLPLAYCIVTDHLLPSFYFAILREIESRHGKSEIFMKNILQNLYRQKIPAPGEQLTCMNIKSVSPPVVIPPNMNNNKYTRRLSLENYPKWMKDATSPDNKVNGRRSEDVIFGIKRPNDPRLENTEISDLYNVLGTEVLLTLFSTLLHERKVILHSSCINTLSTCIIGLERLLYPFKWLFPQIVCLPDHISDICEAPFPIFCGTLKPVNAENIENGLIVNLDTKMVVKCYGDENTILPKKLRRSLKRSLELVNLLDESNTLSSALISEAFLWFFVEILTNININDFNKREFIESKTSASVKLFLEWFIETSMFQNFLNTQDLCADKQNYQLFFHKLQENSSLNTNRSFQNVEALIRNCHIINKKSNTYYNRLKALFS
ncbi:DENN domain-containing protein 2B-like [Culicoides brevitarsis]|uniref:DENN domain-containing protein 2B-like n=1 Tax=Culicoides brevitarsis TaxID=469753 RepID=UPI00307B4919